jgi:hypothetical protein
MSSTKMGSGSQQQKHQQLLDVSLVFTALAATGFFFVALYFLLWRGNEF